MIPRSLYEALPYFYFVLGLTALFSTDPFYGKMAGFALTVAAFIIYRMRKAYRRGLTTI